MALLQLSIVIPYDGSRDQFEETLLSVLENRPRSCEVIVVHTDTYDDPYDLGDEVKFVETDSSPDLGPNLIAGQLNSALAKAAGSVFHVLQPGVVVHEGWTRRPVEAFESDLNLGSVSPLIVDAARPRLIESVGVGFSPVKGRIHVGQGQRILRAEKKDYEVTGPSLAAGFYRTSSLRLIEGFNESIESPWADLDVARNLNDGGFRSVVDTGCKLISKTAIDQRQRGFAAGQLASRMYFREFGTVGASWARYPLFVALQVLRQLPSFGAMSNFFGHIHGLLFRALPEKQPLRCEEEFASGDQPRRRAA